MNHTPRIATHLGPFSPSGDRYNLKGYRPAVSWEERIRMAAQVEGLDGVELNFRGLVDEKTAPACKALLDEVGLTCVNVSMNVWGDAQWGLGSLSHTDPGVRRAALDVIAAGMETAKVLGCHLVSLWPAQDGFDYPFQVDYAAQVERFVTGLQAAADAVPDVRICVEYKPKEPRTHLLADTAARMLWMLGKVARPNVGVLLDVGHSLYAYENVAQSAVLLKQEGLLDLLHFNDNYGDWDWDMIPGSVCFWELIELIFWLRETDYRGYYSIDISVPRGDPVAAVQQSVDNIRRLYRLAERLDRVTLLANLQSGDPTKNMKSISDEVFKALGV
jgi:L-rhamnose isomerase